MTGIPKWIPTRSLPGSEPISCRTRGPLRDAGHAERRRLDSQGSRYTLLGDDPVYPASGVVHDVQLALIVLAEARDRVVGVQQEARLDA